VAETNYRASEIIFRQGDESEFAYVIQSGQVEILRDFPENPVRLALLGPGQIFGEMGLVDERPRSLTARALDETRVTCITRGEFVDLLLHKPEDAFRYLRTLFERLRAANTRVAQSGGAEIATHAAAHKDLSVTILPISEAAAQVVSREGLRVSHFPFRVGRRSSRESDPMDINDLFLPDTEPFKVSRNHFSIDKQSGEVLVHDRGSYLGTIVNGVAIGGRHKGASAALVEGENEIVVGSRHSPFRFRVMVQPDQQ